jgi:cytoskeletal protein CcmA (bactofilin family)
MWNKRSQEPLNPKPAYTPPSATEMIKEGIPLSTTPSRSAEAETARGAASIGKSVTIKGQIFSREDLYVDGEINGTLEAHEHRITVGPNGKVEAGIKAREIVILGTVHGNVEASEKIDIRKDARLVGDIKTTRIIIEDGAFFKGSIDITKNEAPRAAAVAPRPQAAAAPAGPPIVTTPAEVKR